MKYFRAYPYGIQVSLLFMLWGTLLFTAVYIVPLLFTRLTGFPVESMLGLNAGSPSALVNAVVIAQGITNVICFMLPAFLFAYLTHPHPADYLGLRSPVLWVQPVLAVLVMLGAMPLLQELQNLMSHLNFGPVVKKMETESENTTNAFMNISTFGGLLKVLLLLAVVPAIGEEMFFRGVVMKIIRKRTINMVTPIITTALFFAFMHFDVYSMPSIFLAGMLLAVIYNVTGSLWCNIAAHMFFNGTQIVLSYFLNNNQNKVALDNNNMPLPFLIGGVIVFVISFYFLLKNKTPLPKTWSDDYNPKEPRDEDWDFMTKN